MRVIIGPLMLASFVTHVLFGCCLHHVHGSEGDARKTVAETTSDCGCDHQDHPGQDSHERQRQHDNCQGFQCVFTRLEAESVGESWAGTTLVTILGDGREPNLFSDDKNRAARPRHGVSRLAVGLNLLYQRFLL